MTAPRPRDQRRPRVLVIDDDVLIGRVLARLLPACDVTVEHDPSVAAQRVAHQEPFELILCDLHMPELGAADVLSAAKREAPWLAERIVVMTGGSTSAADERFLRQSGARVLYKPFGKDELDELVAWASSRASAG